MALEFFFYYETQDGVKPFTNRIESSVPEGKLFKTQVFPSEFDGLPPQWLFKLTILEPLSIGERDTLDGKFSKIPGYDGWGMPTYIPGKWEKVYSDLS